MHLTDEINRLKLGPQFFDKYELSCLSPPACRTFDSDGVSLRTLPAGFERYLAVMAPLSEKEQEVLSEIGIEFSTMGHAHSIYYRQLSDIKSITGGLVKSRRSLNDFAMSGTPVRLEMAKLLLDARRHGCWKRVVQKKQAELRTSLDELFLAVSQQGEFIAFPACELPKALSLIEKRLAFLERALQGLEQATHYGRGALIRLRDPEAHAQLKELKRIIKQHYEWEQIRKQQLVRSAVYRLQFMSDTGAHDEYSPLLQLLRGVRSLGIDRELLPYNPDELRVRLSNAGFLALHKLVVEHGNVQDINAMLRLCWFQNVDATACIPTYKASRLPHVLPAFDVRSLIQALAWAFTYLFDAAFWFSFVAPRVTAAGRINESARLAKAEIDELFEATENLHTKRQIDLRFSTPLSAHTAWQSILEAERLVNAQLSDKVEFSHGRLARLRGDVEFIQSYCRALRLARDDKLLSLKLGFVETMLAYLGGEDLSDVTIKELNELLANIKRGIDRLPLEHSLRHCYTVIETRVIQASACAPIADKLINPRTGQLDDERFDTCLDREISRCSTLKSCRSTTEQTSEALFERWSRQVMGVFVHANWLDDSKAVLTERSQTLQAFLESFICDEQQRSLMLEQLTGVLMQHIDNLTSACKHISGRQHLRQRIHELGVYHGLFDKLATYLEDRHLPEVLSELNEALSQYAATPTKDSRRHLVRKMQGLIERIKQLEDLRADTSSVDTSLIVAERLPAASPLNEMESRAEGNIGTHVPVTGL